MSECDFWIPAALTSASVQKVSISNDGVNYIDTGVEMYFIKDLSFIPLQKIYDT